MTTHTTVYEDANTLQCSPKVLPYTKKKHNFKWDVIKQGGSVMCVRT